MNEGALVAFIQRALEFGQRQYASTHTLDRITVKFGDTAFDFAESEPSLKPSIQHCLVSPDANNHFDSKIRIFADYSGWHLHDEFIVQSPLGELENQTKIRLENMGIRIIFVPRRQAWDIFDTNQLFGVRLLPHKTGYELWEPTSPLAYFCKWIAELDHKTIVHAGSLSINGKGALLVGNGGAGKSGTAIGAMKYGFQSSGDDYTLLSKKSNEYRAHAVFRTVKQDLAGLTRLGLPRPATLNWQNKAVFRPENVYQQGIVDSVPVHVLLAPSIGGNETKFHPVDPVTVFKTLTISTLKQLSGSYAPMFVTCAQLIRDLPCFGVALSNNPEEISTQISTFLGNLKC
ncbi:MAG TPA: hypothetical protein PKC80_00910 [Burkholderiaceae bacterium]|nr:hypothetical protein [Burkholderiaceae bacterium]